MLLFVAGQAHASLHAAEYGTEPHEHDGVPCDIQFLIEATKGLGAPNYAEIPVPCLAIPARLETTGGSSVSYLKGDKRQIRDPPVLLS